MLAQKHTTNNFEASANAMIEVNLYKRSKGSHSKHTSSNILAIDFSARRGPSGVELRLYHLKESKALAPDQHATS